MKNVKFETLKETMKGEKYYILVKVFIQSKSGYCIAVRDEELSVQWLGNDFERALEIYELMSCGELSAIHMNDVIRDMQNEIFV